MDLTGRLTDWWRRRQLTTPRIRTIHHYTSRSQLPQSLPRRALAVIDGDLGPKWIIFHCPCGHGHRVELDADPSHRPHWKPKNTPAGPTITPSIDVRATRRCHYWLRHGEIHWVPPQS